MDCMQCRWDNHASRCQPFGCRNLTSKSTCMAAKCAGQCGHGEMGGDDPHQCTGTYVCAWHEEEQQCGKLDCALDITTQDRCDKSVDPRQIGDGCRWDNSSKACSGDDDDHR